MNQFTTFNTWYCPGGGSTPAEQALEGGILDRKNRPAYTLEQYLQGKAPYVSVAMDSKALPYGTLLYNGLFRDETGNLIPFRVTDTGGSFNNTGLTRMDIATSNINIARTGPNFSGIWQIAGGQNVVIAPTQNTVGILPNINECEGLYNNNLFNKNYLSVNNPPPPSNNTPNPPIALGGDGVTTKYIPQELKNYGNGRLPLNILTPLSIDKDAKLYGPAATSFENLISNALNQGLVFPGITDSYRPIEVQIRLKQQKPSLAATPGQSMHGWGLAIDFNNSNRSVYNPFLQFLKENAYKYNIYALAKVKGDAFYSQGFWRGEEWHWEYRGPTQNVIA